MSQRLSSLHCSRLERLSARSPLSRVDDFGVAYTGHLKAYVFSYLDEAWTIHEEYLVVYRCGNFGWNRNSSFDNMQILI